MDVYRSESRGVEGEGHFAVTVDTLFSENRYTRFRWGGEDRWGNEGVVGGEGEIVGEPRVGVGEDGLVFGVGTGWVIS